MGTAEEQTSSKPSKATSSVQETSTTMLSYPDWSSSMQVCDKRKLIRLAVLNTGLEEQETREGKPERCDCHPDFLILLVQAYYGNGATPFFASPVASPAPHPYIWGGQHPMMPPYGTPVHYPALYPPGGVYAHANIGTAANITTGAETDGKDSDVKGQTTCAKKSKGNSDVGSEKAAETRNATSGSGNEGASQSAESGSEDSSDASDENNNQQESSSNIKGSFDQMLVDGANVQNNAVNASIQASVPGKPVAPMAATNLNTGMDLWNASSAGAVKLRPSMGVSLGVVPAMVGREGLMPDHQWVQDERELKRQKRKQSNRESARRSRLRKQAECEELQLRVESLSNENSALREELESWS